MTPRPTHRGAPLPYNVLAGVVPFAKGWLAATAKLQGITMSSEEPQVFRSFLELLDYKPAYQVIAAFVPIGLLDSPSGKGRQCEQDARRVLGWPRSSAVASSPVRAALGSSTYEEAARLSGGHLSPVTWHQRRRIKEVDESIAPYWQRVVHEVHPELCYFQLNGDKAVKYSKHTDLGKEERRGLLTAKFPGVERILDARVSGVNKAQLLDAAACLWTSRRIVARGVSRLPEDPEWDSQGLRMELIR